MKVKRAYRYRFYPTPEQAEILARTFGCCRFVYNWGLRLRTDAYYERGERLYYRDLSGRLTNLKQSPEHAWLNEVSAVCLQQSLRHLDRAFANFFEGRAKYPKFKKKHRHQKATYASTAFSWDGENLKLAKMSEPLAIVWSRHFIGQPTTVNITKDPANRYFVVFQVEEEVAPKPVVNRMTGIDLGLRDTVVTSHGQRYGNPYFFKRDEKRLAKAQRNLSRKQKGSKNRAKARLKVARMHARINDRRTDFLHKLSTRLIDENQVISAESLQVKNLIQNRRLSKAIADVSWGELLRQLEYKARWRGRSFVQVEKFYPSSKRCHQCGHILEHLPLNMRSWTCPECSTAHDRDVNAATNILAAGLAILAHGEAIRPGRKKAVPRGTRDLKPVESA